MKYSTALLIVAPTLGLAIAIAIATAFLVRSDDSRLAPSAWIVEAAVALNRSAIETNPYATPHSTSGSGTSSGNAARNGQRLRVQRRFAEAAAAYREVVEANPADADSWADLADCLAAAAGNDLTRSRDAIMRALAIDPRHRKALWLRASLEFQEKRYAAAAATWRALQPLVGAGSTDARVIAANIAEADALARPTMPPGRTG